MTPGIHAVSWSNTNTITQTMAAPVLVRPFAAFTDDPLTAGITVKAEHILQLRTRILWQRRRFNLDPYLFTDSGLGPGTTIRAQHILDLRTALAAVYSAAGLTPPSYTDAGLGIGTLIRYQHIQELRAAVAAIE